MPLYEYFCRTCHTKYEERRPFGEADAPIECPTCHEQNSVRALSLVIVHSSSRSASASESGPAMSSIGGGCCGGACGCGHSHN